MKNKEYNKLRKKAEKFCNEATEEDGISLIHLSLSKNDDDITEVVLGTSPNLINLICNIMKDDEDFEQLILASAQAFILHKLEIESNETK